MRIRLLDPLIANQIAAGEVIERPASVVKELLENSLDAGANKIELEILQGGIKQIRVSDNGSGIYQEDLPLAVQRHGTSKISMLDELDCISTLGFRGEALASLAAVSQLILTSCPIDQENAWQVEITGVNRKLRMTPIPHPKGTTITVYDLFFNTPARRKFMRSEKSEFLMIQEIVKRMALSHFHVKFNFNHNQRTIFSLPRADSELQQEQRLSKLFGKGFLQHAFKMDFCAGEMRLWGWLTTSNYHRAQQDQQYFYINKRMVRDKLIQHAIRQVYHNKLPANRHAAYLLFLEINPEMVDVNVHPTKHEVRFRQARFVHDFIVHALKQSFTQSVDYLLIDTPQTEKIKENVAVYENCNLVQNKYPLHQPLKILFSKYLLLDHDQTVLIIDGQLALQNFLNAIIQKKISKEAIVIKPLLIPMRINIGLDKMSVMNKTIDLFRAFAVDVELKADCLVIRAMPESLCDVDWALCIEKLCLEHQTLGIIELLAQEYKIRPGVSGFEQRLLQIWLSLDKEAQHNCSRELLQIDIMRLYN